MKTYSNKSNATRAAKKAGLTTGFTIIKEGTGYAFQAAPAPAPEPAPRKAPKAPKAKAVAKAPAKKAPVSKAVKAPKGGTKKDRLFAMVTKGATTAEIAVAFGWLPHTTRGALSRFCQMYNVEKLKVAGGTRYKIAS